MLLLQQPNLMFKCVSYSEKVSFQLNIVIIQQKVLKT
ncbi:unnamed protein product [Tenebrio molitor]|nr:unnamed protein product [Tenebrio molitor]